MAKIVIMPHIGLTEKARRRTEATFALHTWKNQAQDEHILKRAEIGMEQRRDFAEGFTNGWAECLRALTSRGILDLADIDLR